MMKYAGYTPAPTRSTVGVSRMDKFTKNALIACALLCAFIISSFYVGTALGFNMSGGADDKVNSFSYRRWGWTGPRFVVLRYSKHGIHWIWFD